MATEDAWGIEPVPTDPPPRDVEIGLTADEDGDWTPPCPSPPLPAGEFATVITAAGMRRLWTLALQIRARRHRARRL